MTFSSTTLFACCGAYSNIIFMGQPLINALYGEKGLIFCVAVMFVSTLYLFTVCSILLSLGTDKMKDSAKVLKDSFLNLVFISGAIGFICFAKSILLPKIIRDALHFSANTTVCLSMIYIGFLLAEANLKEVMKDKQVYLFCFLSLIITPIIAKIFGGLFLNGMPLAVLVILMGTPAGALLPSWNPMERAQKWHRNMCLCPHCYPLSHCRLLQSSFANHKDLLVTGLACHDMITVEKTLMFSTYKCHRC